MRRFECVDGASRKFWEIAVAGTTVTVRFGRLGTDGQIRAKTHPSEPEAARAAEQLVREKLAKGYVEGAPPAAAPAPAAVAAVATPLDAYLAILDLVAPGDEALRDQVRLAWTDPAAYVERFAERLALRGIDAPGDAVGPLARYALLDGLIAARLAIEIDVREAPEDVMLGMDGLRSMPQNPARWAWTAQAELDDFDTETFLEIAGKNLRRLGASLIGFDIQSDSYPVVLVPRERASELRAAARRARWDTRAFTG